MKTLKESIYLLILMTLIKAAKALIGEDLRLKENVLISINQGIIQRISQNENIAATIELPSNLLLLPGFVNAHVHLGDAFLKDRGLDIELKEVVGGEGIKHRKLAQSETWELEASIRNSLELLLHNGYTSFADFRELGVKGIALLKRALLDYPLRAIILGRPTRDSKIRDIINSADGLGISDLFSLVELSEQELAKLKNRKGKFVLGIHVSETKELIDRAKSVFGVGDIEKVLSLIKPDFFVHANYANDEDIDLIKAHSIGIIACPLTASYYKLKVPPLRKLLDKGINVALGTDNVLTTNPDPFTLMKYVLHISRLLNMPLSPLEVLKMITVNTGKILNRKIGQISEGFSADFVAINLETPNTKYSRDVYTAVTLRADPRDIEFQMIGGKIIQ